MRVENKKESVTRHLVSSHASFSFSFLLLLCMDSSDPTVRYQQKLVFELLKVSPRLAALHATRGQLHSTTHCLKCGSYLFNGDGQTRVTRMNRKARGSQNSVPPRHLHRSCRICGWKHDTPIDRRGAPLSLASPPASTATAPIVVPERVTTLPSLTETQSSVPPSKTRSKKKKSGLQDLLSRNREIEKARSGQQQGQGGLGLAAFLNGL